MPGSTMMRIGGLCLLLTMSIAAQSQTTTTLAAPAVQDEPNQPEAPVIGGALASAGAGAKPGMFTSVPQAREEIRRAFIKQDYQQVLALNREMVRQFSVDDSNSFYLTAAQLRLADQRELKAGKRQFMRLGDRAPQLAAAPPPVERSLDTGAPSASEIAAAAESAGEMPAVEATPGATPDATPVVAVETPAVVATPIETPMVVATAPTPMIELVSPDDGNLLTPAGEALAEPIETPAGIDALAEPTPAATPEIMATPAANPDEFQIAAVMTPLPEPVDTGVAAVQSVASPGSDLMRNITIAVVACALLTLGGILIIAKRRREMEPEEDLATTLGGLRVEAPSALEEPAAPMERTAVRPGSPEPEPTILEPGLLGEEESVFEPLPAPEAEPELTQTERIDAFTESVFGAPNEPETLEQLAASREAAEPPAVSDGDSLLQITGISEAPETQGNDAAEPARHFLGEALGPPINLDTLPDMPKEKPYQPAPDTISLDTMMEDIAPEDAKTQAKAEGVRDPLVADVTPYRQAEPAPELDETRDASLKAGGTGAEAAPDEITRTSWNRSAESTGSLSPEDSDLPSMATANDAVTSFHPDETVDLGRPGEVDLEATIASSDAEDGPGEATIASPPTHFEVPLGDKPAEEDLFDREFRIGLECFDRQDWGPAVHHLSVAAALRPEQQQVKDKLREARRLRKI